MPGPPLSPLGPRDRLPRGPAAWNAIVGAARQGLGRTAGPVGPSEAGALADTVSAPQTVILVRNDTGAALPAFAVVKLGAPLIGASSNPHALRVTPVFVGTAPDSYLNPFAVLIEPAPEGAIVRAAVLGIVPVDIAINTEGDGWAAPDATAGTARLKTTTGGGPAKIIWRAATTGNVRAVVLLQGDWDGALPGGHIGQVPTSSGGPTGGLRASALFAVAATINAQPATLLYQFQSTTATDPTTDPVFFQAQYMTAAGQPAFFQAAYPQGTSQALGTWPTATPQQVQQGTTNGSAVPQTVTQTVELPAASGAQFQQTVTVGPSPNQTQQQTTIVPAQFQQTVGGTSGSNTAQFQQTLTPTGFLFTVTASDGSNAATTTFDVTPTQVQQSTEVGGQTQTSTFTTTAGVITQAIAGGVLDLTGTTVLGAGSSSANPVWTKYTVSHTALQAASTTSTITLFNLPAKGIIGRVVVKHSTQFAGAFGSYTVEIGVAGDTARYSESPGPLVSNAVGATTGRQYNPQSPTNIESHSASTAITITGKSAGANTNTSTAGSVDVWVETATLP